jgi:hypothetical protein|eukprot:COSAG06_NODE_3488_length_5272_cov_8.685720_6_plen_175_part_00
MLLGPSSGRRRCLLVAGGRRCQRQLRAPPLRLGTSPRAAMTTYHLTDLPDETDLIEMRAASKSPYGPMKIFTGRAHEGLADQVAKLLGRSVGKASSKAFVNGETNVEVHETVRDCDVFIVQPTCNPKPNQYFMEMCFLIDAMRRGGATRQRPLATPCCAARANAHCCPSLLLAK